MKKFARLLLIASVLPSAAGAADPALPDPATISVPDVSPTGDPKVAADGYKFYYFHNPSVSFEEAYRDLKQCRAHLPVGGATDVPGFVPWDEAHRREIHNPLVVPSPLHAAVYSAIGAVIVPKIERGQRSNKMRRCMGTRGYERYAIRESVWETLNEGDEEKLVLMQAKLASGPKPRDAAVTR